MMHDKIRHTTFVLAVSLALVGLTYGLATLSGSLALHASAWLTLVHALGAFGAGHGLGASRWRGQRRPIIEVMIILLLSGFVIALIYDIFRDVTTIGGPQALSDVWLVTIVTLLLIALLYFLAHAPEGVGQNTLSAAFMAHRRAIHRELFAAILVLLSLIGTWLGLPALDRLFAIVMAFFIFVAGWDMTRLILYRLRHEESDRAAERRMARARRQATLGMVLVAWVLVLVVFLGGIYTLQPGEHGVIRRFGRVVADVSSGLHYRLPLIDQLDRIALDQVRQVETGSALVLTGDTNLIELNLRVHYHIADAVAFRFQVNGLDTLISRMAEAVIRQVVATQGVDELLTTGRNAILAQTLEQLRDLTEQHHTGIRVTNVQLPLVIPPGTVAAAFRDVASAREDTNTATHEALAFRNEILPVARGEAEEIVQTARAEKQRKIDLASGEAERFLKQLHAYREAPQITRTRLYLEALERVLPVSREFIIDPSIRRHTTDLWFTNRQHPRQRSNQSSGNDQ
ncbi:MAG: hypothetical protein ETSY2_13310 [Candidatus Entotheonella gemina]|uniref:Protein HflK n=1 Tax=Candidatus Entotheonella gemina TaxID=1429439 RepID=W4MAX7_9BACT|nr:MAG: hypothetical protein ETSY2_13310 [Candidatus Entotheonella gemina]